MVSSKSKKHQNSNEEHKRWEIIFNSLKQILKKQALKLDLLIQERNFLHQRIHFQSHRSSFHHRHFQQALSLLKRQLEASELEISFLIAKSNFQVSSKHKESVVNKVKFENEQRDLDDLKSWFDILCKVSSPAALSEILKAKAGSCTSKDGTENQSKLEKEIELLKRENEMLSLKHKSEKSHLQDKLDFVVIQYKELEGNYTNQLEISNDEINQANEKILNLTKNMEQMQTSSIEKEETIRTLSANILDMKAEANRKDEEISGLSKELEEIKSKISGGLNEPSISLSKGETIRGKRLSPSPEESATNAQLQATISTLRAKLSELQNEADQRSEEISTLSKELKFLRQESSTEVPVLGCCTNESISSRLRSRGNGRVGGDRENAEQLQTASIGKEETVTSMRAKNTSLMAEVSRKDDQIAKLSKELEFTISKKTSGSSRIRDRSAKTVKEDQASFAQLEAMIATLRVKIGELEAERSQKDEQISTLLHELKLLSEEGGTPSLKHCTTRSTSSRLRGNRNSEEEDGVSLNEETSAAGTISEQGGRRSKRKQSIISGEDTPRLFTSQFKIPKLRSPSPLGR